MKEKKNEEEEEEGKNGQHEEDVLLQLKVSFYFRAYNL